MGQRGAVTKAMATRYQRADKLCPVDDFNASRHVGDDSPAEFRHRRRPSAKRRMRLSFVA